MRGNIVFATVMLILVLATNSKRVKVVYWSQKVSLGNYFFLRLPDDKGRPGNPSAPIDVNAFCTTNFRSRFAMLGAENHGNTRRDGPTRILCITVDVHVLCSQQLE